MKELFDNPPPSESENCLTMNIFAPSTPGPPGGRAVLVFIPGGGFQSGGTHRYDLASFAANEDIVAVTFNYRTNIFGFPASPAIPLVERNLGLLDQRFGLDWIRDNIYAFQGDPSMVTLWGISAGAESNDAHILMYGGSQQPPFRAVILESGLISFGLVGSRPEDNNLGNWNRMLQATNCSPTSDTAALNCLRDVPASRLKSIMEESRIDFAPIIDNVTIPANPAQKRASGNFAKVPILTGTVAEEGRSLINNMISMQDFSRAFLNPALFPGDTASQIISSYPRIKDMTDFDVGAAVFTDFLYQCVRPPSPPSPLPLSLPSPLLPLLTLLNKQTQPTSLLSQQTSSLSTPVWRYYLNISLPLFLPANATWLGKYHGVEYPIFFIDIDDTRHTPQSYALTNFVRSAWGRFVRNPEGGPGWSAVGGRFGGSVAVLGDAGTVRGSGATIVDERELDGRCSMFEGVLRGLAGLG